MCVWSIHMGVVHLDCLFCLPYHKTYFNPHHIEELAIQRLRGNPNKLEILTYLYFLYID